MRKSALLARRAPSAAQSTPSLPKSEPEQPVSSERWAHETIYMNPRKKKDGSRDGFLVFTSGKKVVLHNDGGTQISSKTLVPKDELLKSGQSITVGPWECEIGDVVPISSFDSGAALGGGSMPAPVPAPGPAPAFSTGLPRRPLHPVQSSRCSAVSGAEPSVGSSFTTPYQPAPAPSSTPTRAPGPAPVPAPGPALARAGGAAPPPPRPVHPTQPHRSVVSGAGPSASSSSAARPLAGHLSATRRRVEPPPAVADGPQDELILNRGDAHAFPVKVERQLQMHLRPHQVEGVQFMFDRLMGRAQAEGSRMAPSGCVLAHEMGLGKSLQSLVLIQTLLRTGLHSRPLVQKALIVCPASLCDNWRAECSKWLGCSRVGGAPVVVGHGSSRETAATLRDFASCPPQRLLILSYETLQRHVELLAGAPGIELVICDEGHRLKNAAGNKTSEALRRLERAKRIILTGTPVQNNLEEMWALCDFVAPGVLCPLSRFRSIFINPIEAGRQPSATAEQRSLSEARSVQLKALTSQIILHRDSSVQAKFLPPRHEMAIFCRPSETQRSRYERTLAEHRAGGDPLPIIQQLRGLCSCSGGIAADDEDGPAPQAPLVPAETDEAEKTGKAAVLMRLLRHAHDAGDKVVIAAQFQRSLDLLQGAFQARGWGCVRLDGKTPTEKRQDLVDSFNRSGSEQFAFLLSTRAGGTGFNLPAANRMVLYDCDWNPAPDNQAMARVHRPGQLREVRIWRMVTTGSIEEKMLQRQLFKRDMAQQVLHGKSDHQFANKDLKRLFQLDQRTRCATLGLLLHSAGRAADAAKLTEAEAWLPLLPDPLLHSCVQQEAGLLAAVSYACDVKVLYSLHGSEPPELDGASEGEPAPASGGGGGGGGGGGRRHGGAWEDSPRSADEDAEEGEMDDFIEDDEEEDAGADTDEADDFTEHPPSRSAAGRRGEAGGADELVISSDEDEAHCAAAPGIAAARAAASRASALDPTASSRRDAAAGPRGGEPKRRRRAVPEGSESDDE